MINRSIGLGQTSRIKNNGQTSVVSSYLAPIGEVEVTDHQPGRG